MYPNWVVVVVAAVQMGLGKTAQLIAYLGEGGGAGDGGRCWQVV